MSVRKMMILVRSSVASSGKLKRQDARPSPIAEVPLSSYPAVIPASKVARIRFSSSYLSRSDSGLS